MGMTAVRPRNHGRPPLTMPPASIARMQKPRLTKKLASFLLICAAGIAGCGGSDEESTTDSDRGREDRADNRGGGERHGANGTDAGGRQGGRPADRDEPPTPAPKDEPGTYGSSAPDYAGRYVIPIDGAQAGRMADGFQTEGDWTVILGGGAANISSPKRGFVNRLKVSGGRMTFTSPPRGGKPPRSGKKKAPASSASDPCGDAAGTYEWSFEDRQLRLDPVSDPCPTRRIVLSGSWVRRR